MTLFEKAKEELILFLKSNYSGHIIPKEMYWFQADNHYYHRFTCRYDGPDLFVKLVVLSKGNNWYFEIFRSECGLTNLNCDYWK